MRDVKMAPRTIRTAIADVWVVTLKAASPRPKPLKRRALLVPWAMLAGSSWTVPLANVFIRNQFIRESGKGTGGTGSLLHFWSVFFGINRLPVRALDVGPSRFDEPFHIFRHRHIVEARCHSVAVGVRPSEELQGLLRSCGIGNLLWHQDEGRSRDWPSLGTGLIGDDQIEAIAVFPVRVCSGGLDGFAVGFDRLAVLIDHLRGRELVLLGIGGLDITNRILCLLNVIGNAFVAFSADADWPLDRGRRTDLRFPVGADFRKVVREVKCRTRDR